MKRDDKLHMFLEAVERGILGHVGNSSGSKGGHRRLQKIF